MPERGGDAAARPDCCWPSFAAPGGGSAGAHSVEEVPATVADRPMDAPVDLLRRVNDTLVQEQRSQGLAALEALVKSGEFRDWPLDRELYEQLFALLPAAFSWRGPEAKA
ncbi:unnamed protein product, partial [Prorocentrum cordatum]